MKPIVNVNPADEIVVGGTSDNAPVVTTMQIDNTRKMFELLINNIYSEKEKTVVRELMANAFDAHVAAGIPDKPIDVWLPTQIAPNFVVRDYGVGMSDEFVKKLYSRVGYSTKTDSNDETGTFGVGSKSPLSISDTFMLRCFDDNGVRSYTIVVPPDSGIPQIVDGFAAYASGADRQYGVEVTVPVGKASIEKLADGLVDQHFAWFDKPVNFQGVRDIDFTKYETITKLADGLYFGTLKEEYANTTWKAYVRQGAAVYPLSLDKIFSMRVHDDNYREFINKLSGSKRKVLFDVPIGTANVTAAREHLSYDTQSCENIYKFVAGAIDAFMVEIEKHVFPVEHLYDALDKTCAFLLPEDKRDSLIERFVIGKAILPFVSRKMAVDPAYADIPRSFQLENNSIEGAAISFFPSAVTHHIKVGQREDRTAIEVPSITYIINRGIPEWRSKIERHLLSKVLVNESTGPRLPVNIIQCGKTNAGKVRQWFKDKNLDRHVYMSADICDAPAPKVAKRTSIKEMSPYSHSSKVWLTDKVEADLDQPAYYVISNNRGGRMAYWFGEPASLLANPDATGHYKDEYAMSRVIESGLVDTNIPLYRVSLTQLKRVAKRGKWIDVIQHVKDKVNLLLAVNPGVLYNYRGMNFQATGLHSMFEAAFLNADSEAIKCVRVLCEYDESFAAVAAWFKRNVAHLRTYGGRRSDKIYDLCEQFGIKFEPYVPEELVIRLHNIYCDITSSNNSYKNRWKSAYYYVVGMTQCEEAKPSFDIYQIPDLLDATIEFMVEQGLKLSMSLNIELENKAA